MPASAQTARDVGQIPLEELMRLSVERVFGASDRLQPVTEAPSSVTIVTADDISRYGYRTLADILRGVRGFYVTNDRNYSYVGVARFRPAGRLQHARPAARQRPSRQRQRLRPGVVGEEFGIDVAMFERVEIIRGPASSLYGTSAFFAVVNVVTRTARSLNGASFDVDAGTLGTQLVTRIGRRPRLANGIDFALSGTYERSNGVSRLYLPAFDAPGDNGGVAENLDGEQSGQVYGRFSMNNLTVTGTFGQRLKDVPTASFFSVFNAQRPSCGAHG